MSGEKYLSALKTTLVELVDQLKNVFEGIVEQGELMIVGEYYKNKDENLIMDDISSHVLPFKTEIEDRNRSFFLNNKNVFGGLPESRVSHYTNYIQKNLDEDEMEIIWQYLNVMIQCAEMYKKIK